MFLSKWLGYDDIIEDHEITIALLQRNLDTVKEANSILVNQQKAHVAQLKAAGIKERIFMPDRPQGPVLTVMIDYINRTTQAKQALNPVTLYQIIFEKIKDTNDESDRLRREGLHGPTLLDGGTGPVSPAVANQGTNPRGSQGSGPDSSQLGQGQQN